MPTRPLREHERSAVEANRKLAFAVVRQLVRRYPSASRVIDDLDQAALEELCLAAAEYDRRRGASWTTYAWSRIRNRVAYEAARITGPVERPRTWRDPQGRKRTDLPPDVWATVDVYDPKLGLAGDAGLSEEAVRAEVAGHIHERARSGILARLPAQWTEPQRDVDVFVRVEIDGEKRRVAAEAWGVSPSLVDYVRNRVRPYFQEWAEEVRKAAA